ncbi:beta class carbonic anhydrase [Verticillium dahliae]|nr:Zinc finger protein [Verticillium dahliae VDG2]KAH6704788.1 beta class carbonic anhydrase [Verticillium dahliae]PNH51434.1 hypothetical protein VD0003_g5803 [Verticillium dahliae]
MFKARTNPSSLRHLTARLLLQPSSLSASGPSPLLSASTAVTLPQRATLPRFCSSHSNSNSKQDDPPATSNSNSNSNNTTPSSKPNTYFSYTDTQPPKMAEQDITKYLTQTHDRLFEHNKVWAAEQAKKDPEFFTKLSAGQTPEYLWIGCADSRIPAEQITGLQPGEAFIHRNIANLVCNIDLNVMSVINYAVRHLHVKHIIVCGHYGCGGVKAAMTPKDLGILNPWLRNIRDVYRLHENELDQIKDESKRYDRLVELNVVEQCRNVIKSAAVQQSYKENKYPIVHGWVFGFQDGLLHDLKIDFESVLNDIQKIYNLNE